MKNKNIFITFLKMNKDTFELVTNYLSPKDFLNLYNAYPQYFTDIKIWNRRFQKDFPTIYPLIFEKTKNIKRLYQFLVVNIEKMQNENYDILIKPYNKVKEFLSDKYKIFIYNFLEETCIYVLEKCLKELNNPINSKFFKKSFHVFDFMEKIKINERYNLWDWYDNKFDEFFENYYFNFNNRWKRDNDLDYVKDNTKGNVEFVLKKIIKEIYKETL